VAIGRGPDAELRLSDPGVSRLHCRVYVADGKVWLADAGSAGGTTINGAGAQRQELATGDLIRVGTTEIQFHWSDSDEKATTAWDPREHGAGPAAG
jgi:pSer/pThr/pTyr-binding forkhead associated (FHA) protein